MSPKMIEQITVATEHLKMLRQELYALGDAHPFNQEAFEKKREEIRLIREEKKQIMAHYRELSGMRFQEPGITLN